VVDNKARGFAFELFSTSDLVITQIPHKLNDPHQLMPAAIIICCHSARSIRLVGTSLVEVMHAATTVGLPCSF